MTLKTPSRNPESGISMIEVLMAGTILTICSIGMVALVSTSIATNNRNKVDSTTTMLAGSIIEQINSTIIGSETASLTDCAGTVWTINTAPGGADLSGSNIDFTQTSPPADYFMNYVVNSPCTSTGALQAVYDVRWNVDIVGAPSTPTNTFMITVGARMQNGGQGNLFFAAPVNLRVMTGN
jgi:hypothetical protein